MKLVNPYLYYISYLYESQNYNWNWSCTKVGGNSARPLHVMLSRSSERSEDSAKHLIIAMQDEILRCAQNDVQTFPPKTEHYP